MMLDGRESSSTVSVMSSVKFTASVLLEKKQMFSNKTRRERDANLATNTPPP